MTYPAPPPIPRRPTRPWWPWILWGAGILSIIAGIHRFIQYRKPYHGTMYDGIILTNQVYQMEGSVLVAFLIVAGIVAFTTSYWQTAWIAMALIAGLIIWLGSAAARYIHGTAHFPPFAVPAALEQYVAPSPWFMIGGACGIIVASLLALAGSWHDRRLEDAR